MEDVAGGGGTRPLPRGPPIDDVAKEVEIDGDDIDDCEVGADALRAAGRGVAEGKAKEGEADEGKKIGAMWV